MINRELENKVIDNIQNLFARYNSELISLGITYEINLKKDDYSMEKIYNSEVELNFYLNSQFFDIIEFFVYRNGKSDIDMDSMILELNKDIEEIICKLK